ncbi:MAG: DMT family transporter [Steroidobacteraceae bacterium]
MSCAPLSFGTLGKPSPRLHPLSPKSWTFIGALSIPLWATWPALAIRTFEMPSFESLAITFLMACLLLGRLKEPEPGDAGPSRSMRSWLSPFVFALGLSGGEIFFLLAARHVPAAQANLISYLWPVMIVVFGSGVGLFRVRMRQIVGLVPGFLGAAILMWDGGISISIIGIGLALLSGACWAAYCVFRLLWKDAAGNILARGCGISTVLCAGLHFFIEPTVVPGLSALGAAVVAGIIPFALGNFVWDEGFRWGDSQLLAVMAYATPLCSALLLAALGAASLTWNLLIGAAVIVSAGLLSHADAAPGKNINASSPLSNLRGPRTTV